MANCFATQAGTAEIDYGVSGVCHQTANRILLPAARIKVSAARGYNVSFIVFGDYGRRQGSSWTRWLRRLADCIALPPNARPMTDHNDVANQRVLGKGGSMSDDQPAGNGDSRDPTLDDLLAFMNGGGSVREQMRSLCNAHLTRELSDEDEESLVGIKLWFDDQQTCLVDALEAGDLDRGTYLNRMNAIITESMDKYRSVLGRDRFMSVFGEAGLESDKLIDEGVFLARQR